LDSAEFTLSATPRIQHGTKESWRGRIGKHVDPANDDMTDRLEGADDDFGG